MTFGKQFWLRFLITHRHMLMYIDGRLIAAHPLSPSHPLKEGDALRIKVSPRPRWPARTAALARAAPLAGAVAARRD